MWERLRAILPGHRNDPLGAIPDGLVGESYEHRVKNVPWILLWLDAHPAHIYDAELLEEARYHKVLFQNFVTHTTHICQTLDSGLNTAIKVRYPYPN